MTDLSQRIMDAWLAVNPKPDKWETDKPYEKFWDWRHKKLHLKTILACGAYESAVIQFLVHDRYKRDMSLHINPMSIDMGGNDYKANLSGHKAKGSGRCFAEALLNAILAARDA